MAKRKKRSGRRIPKARVVPRLQRFDVTRAEYNRLVKILNQRRVILNGLSQVVNELRSVTDIQFKRIAQLQAELDALKRARVG